MITSMKKIICLAVLAFSFSLTGCVDNPYVTEDNYLDRPYAGKSWIVGLKKQLALTTNSVVINTEITSDNYYNNYSQYTKVFDIPQIDYFDPDVDRLQASIQALREMAVYGLETVLPKDEKLTQSEIAFMHFCKGYSFLLAGELFVGLPTTSLGPVASSQELLKLSVSSLETAYALSEEVENKQAYALLLARANYRLGNREQAKQYAQLASANNQLLYKVTFDGENGVANEMQNATFDALPNRLAPLPRLDFLDPKFFSVGVPASDQKAVALAKVEEAHLILAELAIADGIVDLAKEELYKVLQIIQTRPTMMVDDSREKRNGGKRDDYPLTAVGVKFDAEAPVREGLVLDRQQGKVKVYTVSGTSITTDQIAKASSIDEVLYLVYLMRQEVFISEGRRLADLGIKYPISQIEAGNNTHVTAEYTKALIPAFIPLDYGLDDFSVDPVTQEVTMAYDMNRVLVTNKTSPYVMPILK